MTHRKSRSYQYCSTRAYVGFCEGTRVTIEVAHLEQYKSDCQNSLTHYRLRAVRFFLMFISNRLHAHTAIFVRSSVHFSSKAAFD